MPTPRRLKPKNKTKHKLKFTPSRLVKTNGKFSRGKLATMVVAFAAVSALVISLAHAWTYSDVVNWQEASSSINHDPWVAIDLCSSGAGGCEYPIKYLSSGEIIWWGPYHRLGIPSPTGMNDALCVNYSVAGAVDVTFKAEVTANYGRDYLGGYYYTTPTGIAGYHLFCGGVHVPPSIAGYWDNVEYRVRYIGHYGGSSPTFFIAQVGLFQ